MEERIELPPSILENEQDIEEIRMKSPPESPANGLMDLGALLQSASNKSKLRSDVDGAELLKNIRDKRVLSPRDSPKSDTSNKAKNLFSHLKKISEHVEKEDEREKRRHCSRSSSRGSRYKKSHPEPDRSEEKALLLQTYHLLQAQGQKSDMKLDITADYITIKSEVTRMQTELNSSKCVKFARKLLIAFVSGIEFLNGKYDPLGLHLSGWSEHVMTTLGDYDSCFLRLYDKYKDTATALSPEAEFIILLGGSGVMFHLTQSFINQNVPKFQDVAKESPELAEKIAGIMAAKYKQSPPDESDSDDDDGKSVSSATIRGAMNRVPTRTLHQNSEIRIPTEMLSTPAFPSMIQQMVRPRPKHAAPRPRQISSLDTIKEIETDIYVPPLKEKSEKVLVIS